MSPEVERIVLDDLKILKVKFDDLGEDIANLRVDIATLKIKSGIWGLLGGAIPVCMLLGLYLLKTFM